MKCLFLLFHVRVYDDDDDDYFLDDETKFCRTVLESRGYVLNFRDTRQ